MQPFRGAIAREGVALSLSTLADQVGEHMRGDPVVEGCQHRSTEALGRWRFSGWCWPNFSKRIDAKAQTLGS
jgi:hypothetical protein